jgi:hypothetical protein
MEFNSKISPEGKVDVVHESPPLTVLMIRLSRLPIKLSPMAYPELLSVKNTDLNAHLSGVYLISQLMPPSMVLRKTPLYIALPSITDPIFDE